MDKTPKSLFKKEDEDFLKRCVSLSYDGMKHLNHWNYERNVFFDKYFPKNKIGAEIGVHCGKNAYRIYNICKPNKLYLIDPWDRTIEDKTHTQNTNLIEQKKCEDCCRMFFDNKDDVSILKKWSIEASKEFKDDYFDWLYIDADHSYKAVIEDLNHWSKKVKPGGFMGGHDYDNRGGFIQKALEKFLKENIQWRFIYKPPANLWQKDSSDGHYDFLLIKSI